MPFHITGQQPAKTVELNSKAKTLEAAVAAFKARYPGAEIQTTIETERAPTANQVRLFLEELGASNAVVQAFTHPNNLSMDGIRNIARLAKMSPIEAYEQIMAKPEEPC